MMIVIAAAYHLRGLCRLPAQRDSVTVVPYIQDFEWDGCEWSVTRRDRDLEVSNLHG